MGLVVGDHTTQLLATVYAGITVLLTAMTTVLLYLLCSRRYRLNWYDKSLLDEASGEEGEVEKSPHHFGQSQSVSHLESASTATEEFWVPPQIHRQASFCQGETRQDQDDSGPGTPNTPVGVQASPFTLSQIGVARTPSKTRPKVPSMFSRLDHTQINADLYKKQESLDGQEECTGSVTLTLFYNTQFNLLCVTVLEVNDLVARDYSGLADPYLKIFLLPDNVEARPCSPRSQTLNPAFNEEFTFELARSGLESRILEILVYDHLPLSQHLCLGATRVSLADHDLLKKTTLTKKLLAAKNRDQQAELGELMFSMSYLPSAERLTVIILKARHLKTQDEAKKLLDPYVKVVLYGSEGQRLKKKKTTTKKATDAPVFNEALIFDLSADVLRSATLEFTVMNALPLGGAVPLGRVVLSPNSRGDEGAHLRNVIAKKRGAGGLAMWHALIPPSQ